MIPKVSPCLAVSITLGTKKGGAIGIDLSSRIHDAIFWWKVEVVPVVQVSFKAVLVRKGDITFGAGERRAINVYFGIRVHKAIFYLHLMGIIEMFGKPVLVGVMLITFGTVEDGTVDIDFSIRVDKGSWSQHHIMHVGAMVSIALYGWFGQLAGATVKVGVHWIG